MGDTHPLALADREHAPSYSHPDPRVVAFEPKEEIVRGEYEAYIVAINKKTPLAQAIRASCPQPGSPLFRSLFVTFTLHENTHTGKKANFFGSSWTGGCVSRSQPEVRESLHLKAMMSAHQVVFGMPVAVATIAVCAVEKVLYQRMPSRCTARCRPVPC